MFHHLTKSILPYTLGLSGRINVLTCICPLKSGEEHEQGGQYLLSNLVDRLRPGGRCVHQRHKAEHADLPVMKAAQEVVWLADFFCIHNL